MSDKSINTFVFIHAGSTGVQEDGHEVKITDLCLIAIKANHIHPQRDPRIQNMIHLCFNPQVTTENSKLSQLFIDDLAKESAFTDHDLYLLHAFLKRLRGPVCFVAHNGAKFIYSVLRKYIQAFDYKFAMDYVCVDTIRGFKTGSELPMVSLKDLYENTTGKHANIHVSAEMDMKMLVECACREAGTFIAWANSSHTPFIPVSNSNCTISYWDDVKPSV